MTWACLKTAKGCTATVPGVGCWAWTSPDSTGVWGQPGKRNRLHAAKRRCHCSLAALQRRQMLPGLASPLPPRTLRSPMPWLLRLQVRADDSRYLYRGLLLRPFLFGCFCDLASAPAGFQTLLLSPTHPQTLYP